MFFQPLVYASGYLVLLFLAICMACGLYYMAELAEEYSRLTKKVLKYSIWAVLAIHGLLLVLDGFPFFTTLYGIALHVVYYQFLKDFPFVNFSSPLFLGACAGLVLNHWLWIVYFREQYQYRVPQIMAFFVPCVWLVPFGFFVSVSLGDTVLPSATHSGGLGVKQEGQSKASALKGLLQWFSSKRDILMSNTGMQPSRDYYGKGF
uniref:Protein TEX261 n=1 Tax=Hanusia phi TaxID=3032 RepID=A0A7S0F458_9CRYP|mmetsp:Transcript_36253/g.81641  ORF Transcript_36253/g.81641 Transcript_36253/m.81641 type:complete len:205 (+) Transcript_36253:60-674(+)